MTWPAFFVGWALVLLAFTLGCGWASRSRVRRETFEEVVRVANEGLAREKRLIEMLGLARQPKITILPGVDPPDEQFDWRGAGL